MGRWRPMQFHWNRVRESREIKCRSFQRNVCRCNFFIVFSFWANVAAALAVHQDKNSIRIDHGMVYATIGAFAICLYAAHNSNVRMSTDFIFSINNREKQQQQNWKSGNSVDCFVVGPFMLASYSTVCVCAPCPSWSPYSAPPHKHRCDRCISFDRLVTVYWSIGRSCAYYGPN